MVETIKNKPLSQSLQKQTQGKDLLFNKILSILIQIESIYVAVCFQKCFCIHGVKNKGLLFV